MMFLDIQKYNSKGAPFQRWSAPKSSHIRDRNKEAGQWRVTEVSAGKDVRPSRRWGWGGSAESEALDFLLALPLTSCVILGTSLYFF